MSNPNFIDYVKIYCRSGQGGAGSVHFRREKYIPKGGPDGGDGGRGGSIYIRGNQQLWTLLHLKYKRHIFAGDGESGSGARCTGKDGKDEIIEVPVGTIAKNVETGEVIAEVVSDGQTKIIMKGGRGGQGNWHFKSPTMQTPRFAQPGEPCEEGYVILELKILADVGLVGFPNAGKSTLLSVVSAAKPKIADYPFTTLTPNVGIVGYHDDRSFVMADIPGIIEVAHEGKGLGLRFLRHIERNSMLLFMVPADSEDVLHQYSVLVNELRQYNPELLDKKRALAITKCDLADEHVRKSISLNLPDVPSVFISSVTGEGIERLKDLIWSNINTD